MRKEKNDFDLVSKVYEFEVKYFKGFLLVLFYEFLVMLEFDVFIDEKYKVFENY